jgi:predicted short-subunit dehydrogenase-like oxidoreductase (DUF2520 family)
MKHFLVIGSGRWARHLLKSLALAGVSHSQWARRTHNSEQLDQELRKATHVWLAVADAALPEWSERTRATIAIKIHSSGALEIPGLHSVHPLMSFPETLYADSFYPRFAFVSTSDLPREELIPGLPNPLFYIPAAKKTYYHALCVLAGNGGVLLWQKFFAEMSALGIDPEPAKLYASRIFENILDRPFEALTGPLVRNDQETLRQDLQSMSGDPFQQVLQAMIHAYAESRKAVP